jgi:membrane-associated phospholipid phosphatase
MLMISYGLLIIIYANPYQFSDNSFTGAIVTNKALVFSILLMSFLFPMLAVLLMRGLKLVDSLELKTNNERIGPLIATGIMYLWLYINLRKNDIQPYIFQGFVLGAVITLFVCFFINNFSKISIHTAGAGGLLGLMVILHRQLWYNDIGWLFMLVVLAAGFTGTARLLLKAHSFEEVTGGYIVGICGQVIAMTYLHI